jgi:hypothetical protein
MAKLQPIDFHPEHLFFNVPTPLACNLAEARAPFDSDPSLTLGLSEVRPSKSPFSAIGIPRPAPRDFRKRLPFSNYFRAVALFQSASNLGYPSCGLTPHFHAFLPQEVTEA